MQKFLGNKVHFTSLGCPRNLVDSEVMLGTLLQAGYEPASCVEEADFLIVNTCGFLEESRQESCDTIATLFGEKKSEAKVIVTGCMVQKHGKEIREKFPNVHYFLGSGDVEKILEAVRAPEAGDAITSAKSFLQWGEVPRQLSTPKHYAYLKIAEGCRKRCAFCLIPSIKGPLKSKSHEQVLKEFRALLQSGVKEVILIAQDLGDFGKERKEIGGLEALLKELLSIEGDFWLRLLYLYPDEITEGIIELIEKNPRLCPYLDMPIQHINNVILKAMHRTTSKEAIIAMIDTLHRRVPHIVIRTILMVGFPGETEEQFEELVDFVKNYPLDNVGIFKFSSEEGTKAATLARHVDEETKTKRHERLARVQLESVRKNNQRFIGQRLKVLVEGYHPESKMLMRGRFYGQCPEIDGHVIINDGRKVKAFGEFYEVEITDCFDYDLVGKVVHPTRSKTLSLVHE